MNDRSRPQRLRDHVRRSTFCSINTFIMRFLLSSLLLGSALLGAGCVSSSPSRTSSFDSVSGALAVDTSSWKTYTNTDCGFSFKYPADAVFAADLPHEVTITTQEDADVQKNQDGEAPSTYFIDASCKDFDTTLDGFFGANTNTLIQKIGSASVGGVPAIAAQEGAGQSYSLWVEREKVLIFDFSSSTHAASDLSDVQRAILESLTLE